MISKFGRFMLTLIAVMATFTMYDVMMIRADVTHQHPLPDICYEWDRDNHVLSINSTQVKPLLRTKRMLGTEDRVVICNLDRGEYYENAHD